MKKLFLLLLFTSGLCAASELPAEVQRVLTQRVLTQRDLSQNFKMVDVPLEKRVAVFERIKEGIKFTSDSLDGIMTKKGLAKVLIVFVVYCYLFPPEPLTETIGDIFSFGVDKAAEILARVTGKVLENGDNLNIFVESVGDIQGRYEILREAGSMDALYDLLLNSPLKGLSILTGKAINKIWDAGIPFLSVILANKVLNVQH